MDQVHVLCSNPQLFARKSLVHIVSTSYNESIYKARSLHRKSVSQNRTIPALREKYLFWGVLFQQKTTIV